MEAVLRHVSPGARAIKLLVLVQRGNAGCGCQGEEAGTQEVSEGQCPSECRSRAGRPWRVSNPRRVGLPAEALAKAGLGRGAGTPIVRVQRGNAGRGCRGAEALTLGGSGEQGAPECRSRAAWPWRASNRRTVGHGQGAGTLLVV